jgi:hypothetical protein
MDSSDIVLDAAGANPDPDKPPDEVDADAGATPVVAVGDTSATLAALP